VAAVQPAGPGGRPSLVERLRAVHLEMVDAVLGGDGLDRVAELASGAAGGPVAIVVPRLRAVAVSPRGAADPTVLRRHIGERVPAAPNVALLAPPGSGPAAQRRPAASRRRSRSAPATR
jgi:hypothetical protein